MAPNRKARHDTHTVRPPPPLALLGAVSAQAAPWVAGKHYTVIPQAQRTNVPRARSRSWKCFRTAARPATHFLPRHEEAQGRAARQRPARVSARVVEQAAENWPLFQRAYLTAQSLGVADKAHDAMFQAIWSTGELGITDKGTRRLKSHLPSIEDIARFYQRVAGVKAADFVKASKSFSVDLKMRQADSQIIAMQVSGTPTLVVNGKYRVNNENLQDERRHHQGGAVPRREGKRARPSSGPGARERGKRDLRHRRRKRQRRTPFSYAGTTRSRARSPRPRTARIPGA